MKIRITRRTTVNGNDREPRGKTGEAEEGDVINVTRACAQLLVGMRKAEHADNEPLIEAAEYEIETATVEAVETAEAPRARKR